MNSLASLESENEQATTIMSFSRFGRLPDNSLLHISQALRAGEDVESNVFTLLIDETKSLYTCIKAHVNLWVHPYVYFIPVEVIHSTSMTNAAFQPNKECFCDVVIEVWPQEV